MKRCKKRLCIKQVNRSVRVHNRDWRRWHDRHTYSVTDCARALVERVKGDR